MSLGHTKAKVVYQPFRAIFIEVQTTFAQHSQVYIFIIYKTQVIGKALLFNKIINFFSFH